MPTQYEITVTELARDDIASIHAYLTGNASFPHYAEKVRNELVAAIGGLTTFPLRGALRGRDGRRILLTRSGYNLVYRVAGEGVVVLRIRHQRQKRATQP